MTEFDATGLSAVASFFGDDVAKAGVSRVERSDAPSRNTPEGGGGRDDRKGRLGLGASSSCISRGDGGSSAGVSSATKKRLLSVGRKRGRSHDDEAAVGVDDEYEEMSDDEEGRTTVVKVRHPRRQAPVADEADIAHAPEVEGVLAEETSKKKKKAPRRRGGEATGEAPTTADDGEAAAAVEFVAPPNKKRKRRKVRSRQKNIRKDNRRAMDKPSHLVLGRSMFAGRPLTKETREFLCLPESRTSRQHAENRDDGGGSSKARSKQTRADGDAFAPGLGVEDLLDVSVATSRDGIEAGKIVASNVVLRGMAKKKKNRKKKDSHLKKKAKKPRYKNLIM